MTKFRPGPCDWGNRAGIFSPAKLAEKNPRQCHLFQPGLKDELGHAHVVFSMEHRCQQQVSVAFSSPEPTILLACGRDRELWLVPNQEVRESRTSGSSTQTQKFETIVVANGYKNAPSQRLRIFRNWPELSIPEGSWALGTRMVSVG